MCSLRKHSDISFGQCDEDGGGDWSGGDDSEGDDFLKRSDDEDEDWGGVANLNSGSGACQTISGHFPAILSDFWRF